MDNMTEEGKFICKKCGGEPFYDLYKWQKKGDKWIFYAKNPDPDLSNKDWIGKWDYSFERYLERAVYDYPYDDSDYVLIYHWNGHFSNPNDCWAKTGGQTEEQWNQYYKNNYECKVCKLKVNTFTDFIDSVH